MPTRGLWAPPTILLLIRVPNTGVGACPQGYERATNIEVTKRASRLEETGMGSRTRDGAWWEAKKCPTRSFLL